MLFKDIVGQDELKKKFIQEIKGNKVPHANLLLGNLGYGTLPLALAVIQYLLCEQKGGEDSCGECSSCKKVSKLEHPDVHFSFPTVQAISKISDPQFLEWRDLILENPYSSLNDWITKSDGKGRKPIISVSQSAEIIRKLTLKSFDGGYKVSVIWMAEEMNASCANKLLKIIEEPTPNTLFILIAESEDMILPTILSRTQITKVKRIKEEDMLSYFQHRNVGDADLIESVVFRAEGNYSIAKELLDSGSQANHDFQYFVELMRSCYKKDVMAMLKWAEEMSALGRESQKHFIRYALHLIRQSLMKNYTSNELTQTSSEEAKFLNNFAQFIVGGNIFEFNKLFNDAHYSIERNAYSKLLFTNIAFEVMRYIRKA